MTTLETTNNTPLRNRLAERIADKRNGEGEDEKTISPVMKAVKENRDAKILKSNGEAFSNKLITPEDPYHVHKTLGMLSLASFIYRYGYTFLTQGNLGFNGSWFDWASISLHLALSSTSLIFHVIRRRILSRPMIIWEEYRLHAIVFTLRCWSVYAFGRFMNTTSIDFGIYRNVLQYCMVMVHHLVVDEITRRYGKANETTVRAKDLSRPLTKTILRGYSFYQFAALGSHLIPHTRTSDLGYNTLIAIQSSAFLMTLYRKNLIRGKTHGFIYTACLIISIFHIFREFPGFLFGFKLWLAFATRCTFGTNKYLIWAVFSLISTTQFETLFVKMLTENNLLFTTGLENTFFGKASGALFLMAVQFYVVRRAAAIQAKMPPKKTGRERANELQKIQRGEIVVKDGKTIDDTNSSSDQETTTISNSSSSSSLATEGISPRSKKES